MQGSGIDSRGQISDEGLGLTCHGLYVAEIAVYMLIGEWNIEIVTMNTFERDLSVQFGGCLVLRQ